MRIAFVMDDLSVHSNGTSVTAERYALDWARRWPSNPTLLVAVSTGRWQQGGLGCGSNPIAEDGPQTLALAAVLPQALQARAF